MKKIIPFFILFLQIHPLTTFAQKENYQIGDSWSRETINIPKGVFGHFGSQFTSLVKLIGRFNGGTATYLGKFNQSHIVITNHHVCSKPVFCIGQYVRFTNTNSPIEDYGSIWAKSQKLLITIPEIELSLIEVRFSELDEEKLMLDLSKNLKYQKSFEVNQKLLALGYGIYKSPSRGLSIAYDDDCTVFSSSENIKKMKDPDEVNPVGYQVWSAPIGCDTSHGDSGAPVINRRTGEILGLVWTGKVPKSPSARSSKIISQWKKENNPLIWKELTYMVPLYKMKNILRKKLVDKNLPPRVKLTITDWVQSIY